MMRVGLYTRPYIALTTCYPHPSTHTWARPFAQLAASRTNAANRLKSTKGKTAPGHKKSKNELDQNNKAYEYSSSEAIYARHVLRAILRECTYLPDAAAAGYIKRYALSRFRENGYKAWKDRALFEEQDKLRSQQARHHIYVLQRANEGERKALLKVLKTAYGRVGKRRHELMRPLLLVKTPEDENASSLKGADNQTAGHGAGKIPPPTTKVTPNTPLNFTPQMLALLKSQISLRPPESSRRNPRSIQATIPELNSWHRPTPQKVIRNKLLKHYAYLLERIQVPLPLEEWERLRNLALGKVSERGAVPRRRKTKASGQGTATASESALEMVARYGKVPDRAFENRRAHQITPRFMQRLYADIFSYCPTMDWDAEKEEWKVTWGFQTLFSADQPVVETE